MTLWLSGAGAGFKVIWANENNKTVWETYKHNHPKTFLDTCSITDIKNSEIPECDGIIGGSPCQSWSLAGIHEYLWIVRAKMDFYLVKNVAITH
jgi:DNA (cytosine-5)-methyltransferase 1